MMLEKRGEPTMKELNSSPRGTIALLHSVPSGTAASRKLMPRLPSRRSRMRPLRATIASDILDARAKLDS